MAGDAGLPLDDEPEDDAAFQRRPRLLPVQLERLEADAAARALLRDEKLQAVIQAIDAAPNLGGGGGGGRGRSAERRRRAGMLFYDGREKALQVRPPPPNTPPLPRLLPLLLLLV